MAERYKIAVEVISQKGKCNAGHKVGDKWVVGNKTPEGICLSAFASLFPNIRALTFGANLPWESDPDFTDMACPDPVNPVVFSLRRIRENS